MTDQTKIDPQEALAVLDQAYGYYQPEPALVDAGAADAAEDQTEDEAGFAYYRAA